MGRSRVRRTGATIGCVLLLGGLIAGSFVVAPAGAHDGGTLQHRWKDHYLGMAKDDFFTKKQVNQKFAKVNKKVPRLFGAARDWPAVGAQVIVDTDGPSVALSRNVKAPKKGILLLNYSAWTESVDEIRVAHWLEMDTADPCVGGFSGAPGVPGSMTLNDFRGDTMEGSISGTGAASLTKGAHEVHLCTHVLDAGAVIIPDASLTALFVNSGSNILVEPAPTSLGDSPRSGGSGLVSDRG